MLWVCVAPEVALQADMPDPLSWLSESEQRRARGLKRLARRANFLIGRWLLRRLVVHAGGTGVALEIADSGRSRVVGDSRWHLSLSHSGTWLAAALSDAGPVGIDLEHDAPHRDWAALAAFLGWAECPDAAAFYRRWTLGEAWLKASPQPMNLLDAQALHWRLDPDGVAWQARCPSRGLHLALVTTPSCSAPRWLAVTEPSLVWRDAGRWSPTPPGPGLG